MLREKARDQVEVYDVITYRLQRRLTVPNARGFTDMTSCGHYRCVHIANSTDECIHRLDEQGGATQWDVSDVPWGVSVNATHNLLVTCRYVRKIKEFSSRGDLLRELTLPDDVINPLHGIQLTSGQFIVCHGDPSDAVHRVCVVSEDGRDVVQSHGGQRGSDPDQYNVPAHLAVDENGFVFVADYNNRRVKLLSPTLDYVRRVVSGNELKWKPTQLCLNISRQHLYVAENEIKDGRTLKVGRVVVFSRAFHRGGWIQTVSKLGQGGSLPP